MNQNREKLDRILEQEEYQVYYEEKQNLFELLLLRVREWLLDMFQKLFPQLRVTDSMVDVTMYILGAIGLGILVLCVFLIKRNLTSNRSSRTTHSPIQSENELKWSYEQHLQEATQYKQNDDFRQATRHLFLAMLLYFDQQKWIQARSWKTNWDYYEELKRVSQQRADQFDELAQQFDEVMYGEKQMERQEFNDYEKQARKWLDRLVESN